MEKLTWLDHSMHSFFDAAKLRQIAKSLEQKHINFLDNEIFLVSASENKNRVQVTCTLQKKDGSMCYPIECVFIKADNQNIDSTKVTDVIINYLSNYWQEYFTEERQVYLPLNWSFHSHENLNFYLRGFVRNTSLEQAAEELFKNHGFGEYEIQPISNEY